MPRALPKPKPLNPRRLRKPWEAEAAAAEATNKLATEINLWVGTKLKLRRLECGLTRHVLALRMNVDISSLDRWESGNAGLNPERIWELSLTLAVTPSYFFEGFGDPEQQALLSKIGDIINVGSLRAVIGLNMLDRDRKNLAKQIIQTLIENAGGKYDITGYGKVSGDGE